MLKIQSTSIKAIIFDHDGTLVDSEGIHCACWNNVLAQFQQTLSYSQYCEDYNGLPTLETARRLRAKWQLETTAESLYQQKIAELNTRLSCAPFPLLAGATELLEHLQQLAMPMAIASGANRHEVQRSITGHRLQPYLQAVSTKNDVPHSKPAPDVYRHAAAQLNVAPQHCLAIEDSDTGEQSARAAGMLCARLTPKPQRHKDSLQFETLLDILRWLKSLST
ncbi:MAG TPA: HAD family phosphatase [Marinagarivorans sp.]